MTSSIRPSTALQRRQGPCAKPGAAEVFGLHHPWSPCSAAGDRARERFFRRLKELVVNRYHRARSPAWGGPKGKDPRREAAPRIIGEAIPAASPMRIGGPSCFRLNLVASRFKIPVFTFSASPAGGNGSDGQCWEGRWDHELDGSCARAAWRRPLVAGPPFAFAGLMDSSAHSKNPAARSSAPPPASAAAARARWCCPPALVADAAAYEAYLSASLPSISPGFQSGASVAQAGIFLQKQTHRRITTRNWNKERHARGT